MPTSLVRFTYVSCSRVTKNGLQEMLDTSKQRNAAADITSGLLSTEQYFCQVLEGPRRSVEGLMERIRRDSRHHSINLVLQEGVSGRQFADWHMGFAVLPLMEQIMVPLFTTQDKERARILGGVLLQTLRRDQTTH